MKASIVERFNRTLKSKIYKEMALRGNYNYTEILDEILNNYNNKVHSTTGLAPLKVNKNNEKMLLETVYNYKRPFVQPKFNVGDFVRVSKIKYIFSKGYHPNWSIEVFKVHKINRKSPCVYILSSLDGKEILDGSFNELELQKTNLESFYLVEKVLKKQNGKAFVKWFGFDNSHNSWVDASTITDLKK